MENKVEPIIKSIDELYAKVTTEDGDNALIRIYLTGDPAKPWTYDFITTDIPDIPGVFLK